MGLLSLSYLCTDRDCRERLAGRLTGRCLVHALDVREAVADLVGDRAGLLYRLLFSLLSSGFLCIAPAVGFFLARDPGQVMRTQDRLGTLSPH